jgi:hypothetical protein
MQIDLLPAESERDAAIAGPDLKNPKHAPVEEHALLDVDYSEHQMIETIGKRRSQRRLLRRHRCRRPLRALRRQEQGCSETHRGNGGK